MKALADLDVTGSVGCCLSAPLPSCKFVEEKPISESDSPGESTELATSHADDY
jgi:hypothetical protein